MSKRVFDIFFIAYLLQFVEQKSLLRRGFQISICHFSTQQFLLNNHKIVLFHKIDFTICTNS